MGPRMRRGGEKGRDLGGGGGHCVGYDSDVGNVGPVGAGVLPSFPLIQIGSFGWQPWPPSRSRRSTFFFCPRPVRFLSSLLPPDLLRLPSSPSLV